MKRIISQFWRALTSTPGPVYCPRCGGSNEPGSNYCGGCGAKL